MANIPLKAQPYFTDEGATGEASEKVMFEIDGGDLGVVRSTNIDRRTAHLLLHILHAEGWPIPIDYLGEYNG